jgi:hypothetical protein
VEAKAEEIKTRYSAIFGLIGPRGNPWHDRQLEIRTSVAVAIFDALILLSRRCCAS